MTKNLLELKLSLMEAIEKWIEEESLTRNWEDLETFVGDSCADLMADSAFNILLAKRDLTKYLEKENHINKI